MHTFVVIAICYLVVNFLFALLLHLHGLRQAHLRPRFLEVLMHFLLFSAVAIPVLLVTTAEALFGREKRSDATGYDAVPQHH